MNEGNYDLVSPVTLVQSNQTNYANYCHPLHGERCSLIWNSIYFLENSSPILGTSTGPIQILVGVGKLLNVDNEG